MKTINSRFFHILSFFSYTGIGDIHADNKEFKKLFIRR